MIGIQITGLKEAVGSANRAPGEMKRAVRQSMSSAASKTARTIKSRTPSRWRSLVATRVATSRRTGNTWARLGYAAAPGFRSASRSSDRRFDWYKSYWNNYGTLARRDQAHRFSERVKPGHWASAKRRRNNAGVFPKHFWEAATLGWEQMFRRTFETSLGKQTKKLLQ